MSDSIVTGGDLVLDDLFGERQARWYQVAALHGVERAFESGKKRVLIELPTGSGKTLTSGLIFSSDRIRKVLGVRKGKKLRLLFIAHKHRLLSQAEAEYADAAGIEFIPQSAFSAIPPVVMEQGWHIACVDEAHHEAMLTLQYALEKLGN